MDNESFYFDINNADFISKSILNVVNEIKKIEDLEALLKNRREELEIEYNKLIIKQGEVNANSNA